MAKFCGKCGSPLNEDGSCPKCDVDKTRPKQKKRKTFLPIFLVGVFLCIAFVGALFANHEGYINIPFLQSDKSNEKSTSATDTPNDPNETFFPESEYATVLKTYKEAFANNYYDLDDEWAEENEYDISKVTPELRLSFGGIKYPLSYCFYDISNDGVPELLISVDYGDEHNRHIVDMLGYENGDVKRLFSLWSFGARGGYSIYPNGVIGFGYGGAMYSGGTYYSLDKNKASPTIAAELYKEYSEAGTKCYLGSDNNQREISESEYDAMVSQFGDEITLTWENLCESKVYECSFSVRGDNGINQGYQQIFVTSENVDELTAVYREVGSDGYPVFAEVGTAFRIKKNGEVSAVKWLDGSNNEFNGTVSYHDGCFTLTFKTSSADAAIKECTGAELYTNSANNTSSSSTSSATSTPSTTAQATTSTTSSSSSDYTADSLWAAFVSNEWTDEDGNRIQFTQNTTYYKLKPDAIHTEYDYYMGTFSMTDSRGHYYGHYSIDEDDKELELMFNDWPEGEWGVLLYDRYKWDPSLSLKNSWYMTSDGIIKFSQGDKEFSDKTFHAR